MAEPACARRMIGGNLGAALLTLKPDWQTAKIRRSATASPNCVMLFGITSDFELTVQMWSKSVVDASYISRRVAEAAGGTAVKQLEEYSQLHGPVSVLDVCCGAGGLFQGLTHSGFFEVELAVDQDILAANTFRENNPRSTVVCTDLNSFLKFSSDRKRGKITDPLVSSDGGVIPNHTVPRLLNLGVLCGDLQNWLGTPCGSFSAANRHKKSDDPRYSVLNF
ncbi:hypothetical protein R3P38DRAFT_2811975 [Favolaschia claudopus]|uniref:Trimethylguanosine synthase n=1 Tax=Favolaschia claudopus TaxID=2862362 RepID=A0AAV9Z8J7_9AGAR